MKKILLLIAVVLFTAHSLSAQDQKFSAQINTGYTWFSGVKPKNFKENTKPAYGTYSNGQIPIELELRYRVVPQFAINFAYGYGIGLPYTDKTTEANFEGTGETYTRKAQSNLSSHALSLGGMYYFTKESKFKPYVGLDLQILLSQINSTNTEEFMGESRTTKSKTNIFANFGLSPKVGFEYDFSSKVYLNASIQYQAIFPSKITGEGQNEDGSINKKATLLQAKDQSVTSGIGIKVGVGFRF